MRRRQISQAGKWGKIAVAEKYQMIHFSFHFPSLLLQSLDAEGLCQVSAVQDHYGHRHHDPLHPLEEGLCQVSLGKLKAGQSVLGEQEYVNL